MPFIKSCSLHTHTHTLYAEPLLGRRLSGFGLQVGGGQSAGLARALALPPGLPGHMFVSPRLEVCVSFLASRHIVYIRAVMCSLFAVLINYSMSWFEVIIN